MCVSACVSVCDQSGRLLSNFCTHIGIFLVEIGNDP